MSADLIRDLAKCDREIAECAAYEGPDEVGAAMGWADNMIEKEYILREMQSGYESFIERKSQIAMNDGFEPEFLPDWLFDFQRHLVEWSVRKGRAAIFADCGMGKTPMQLAWAENVVRHTGGKVLILTPLAVGAQTEREAAKFGIDCRRCPDGVLRDSDRILIANYERLHYFNCEDFAAVVCDESSAIKSFNGERRAAVTEFMRKMKYRLLCTATAAPNDYTELGTSSEALGVMGLQDMLSRFFKNEQNTAVVQGGRGRFEQGYGQKWRFKGHAEKHFWRWVCSWSRACRKPSDLGFSDDRFVLPPLIENEHVVQARTLAPGMLFSMPARDMREEREERRRTIAERCEMAAELASQGSDPVVIWCHLNDEGDMLDKMIHDGRQIKGSTSDDEREEIYDDFSQGRQRVLIVKPKIGAWGMNWQHCNRVVTFASHSYEQYYQGVRRCWRFGQSRPVTVDIIASEGEVGAKDNLRRKSELADKMFSSLVSHMSDELKIRNKQKAEKEIEVPSWL
jgi:hypothetical protein